MKKIIIILLFFLLIVNGVWANEPFPQEEKYKKIYNSYNNTIYGYYKIVDSIWLFDKQSKEKYKTFTPQEKKIYKTHLKADKFYWDKGFKYREKNEFSKAISYMNKAIKINPELWVAYLDIAEMFLISKKPNEAIKYAQYLEQNWFIPRTSLILASSYSILNQYDKAFEYQLKYLKSENPKRIKNIDWHYLQLAQYADKTKTYFDFILDNVSNKNLKDYEVAKIGIKAANIAEKSDDKNKKITAIDIKANLYHKIEDEQHHIEELKKLIVLAPNTKNYIRLAVYTNQKNQSLKYFYLAKLYAASNEDLDWANMYICPIEQKKIDDAVKKLKIYIKAPNWKEISSIKKQLGSTVYWNDRQDLFFKSTNKCIQNYTEKNLANCFNQVNADQEKLTNMLRDDWYRQEQLAIQDQVLYQQQMQTYYASQSAYSQDQSAYYLQKIYQNSLNSNN